MRFRSTPESALKGEITTLAIIECIASVGAYLGMAMYFGTFRYLAAAVVAAPLMLFRTEASSDWGLEVYARYFKSMEVRGQSRDLIYVIEAALIAPFVGIAIRMLAMLFWAVRKPLQTLSGMPQNWIRQSLCTDFFHPPEILPLEAAKGDSTKIYTFSDLLGTFREKEQLGIKILTIITITPILLIGYVPSLLYRISFKATAVAYLPFIWVAHSTLRNPMPTNLRLERIKEGELEKVRRILSWAIIATLAAKLGFILGLVDWSRIEEKFPSKKLVESLVVPAGWPWWQITLAVDAMLTFFLLFFADSALARLSTPQSWSEQKVIGTVSTISFVRAALGLLTISHFFRIALVAVAPGPLHGLLAG